MIWPAAVVAHVILGAGWKGDAAVDAVALVLAASEGDDQLITYDQGAPGRQRFGWWQLAPAEADLTSAAVLLDAHRSTLLVRSLWPTGAQLAAGHPLAGVLPVARTLELAAAAVAAPVAGVAELVPVDVRARGRVLDTITGAGADVAGRIGAARPWRP